MPTELRTIGLSLVASGFMASSGLVFLPFAKASTLVRATSPRPV